MQILKREFGVTKDGAEAFLYELQNQNGMRAVVSDFGAVLVQLFVPDQNGTIKDVILGHPDLKEYEQTGCYFGATVGRNCNRLENAGFYLDGEWVQMPKNENENSLHSGPNGYNFRMWQGAEDEETNSVTFTLFSPDQDQGLPGNLVLSVTYTLTEDNALEIHYRGMSDKKTMINVTNHAYFNLAGEDSGDILNHRLTLEADYYTPLRPVGSIPTGEILPVKGTPMDFTEEKEIGKDIFTEDSQLHYANGYDHNFVLRESPQGIRKFAVLKDPQSGRTMEAFTDCPGVQLYTGNFLEGQKNKQNGGYCNRAGVCLETQFFPNAANAPAFADPFVEAGKLYESVTIYKF